MSRRCTPIDADESKELAGLPEFRGRVKLPETTACLCDEGLSSVTERSVRLRPATA